MVVCLFGALSMSKILCDSYMQPSNWELIGDPYLCIIVARLMALVMLNYLHYVEVLIFAISGMLS